MGAKKGRVPWNKGIKYKIKVKCCVCKNVFEVHPSRFKSVINHYCSKECYNKAHYKIIKCDYCGNLKKYTTSQYNQKKQKNQKLFFCSLKCSQNYHTGQYSAMYEKPSWCRGLTKDNNIILKKKSINMLGEKNPMFNKKLDTSGCNFYFEDLGHRCRSSWEVNFARTLKYLKIKYQYEPKTFKLNKGDSYTPDFYIVDFDLYIEIKGYETQKFIEKFKRFKQEYPNHNILLINEPIYKFIKDKWIDKLDWEAQGKLKKNFVYKEVKIKKITITNRIPKQVYNLSVKDDNSFVINGIMVHNTKPSGFIRKVLDEKLYDLFCDSIKRLGQDALIKI